MKSPKIFAVNSSPNGEKGNTAKLLQAFLEGASEAGAETQVEYIFDQNIKPCKGCLTCLIKTPGKCVQKDDMKKLLEKIKECDILVYSTPLYIHNVNGPMKNFMDRRAPLLTPYLEIRDGYVRHPRSIFNNHKVVVISTCGFPGLHNFDSLVSLFNATCKFRDQEFSGALLRPSANGMSTSELKSVYSAAREAGAELVKDGLISPVLLDRISKQFFSDEDYVETANKYFKEMMSSASKSLSSSL